MRTHLCLASDAFIHFVRLLPLLHLPLILVHYLFLGAHIDFDLAEPIHRHLSLLGELVGIELPVLLACLNESRMQIHLKVNCRL
jgi:predicted membrane-bound spermidine synthase